MTLSNETSNVGTRMETEQDVIARVVQYYIDGARSGKGADMKPASCVRQVLQKVFPKNSVLECRSPSGLWECGKAERFWRSFSKPQRESAPFGGFPLRRHFHQASAFLSFLVLFLSFVPSKVFHSDCSLQNAL